MGRIHIHVETAGLNVGNGSMYLGIRGRSPIIGKDHRRLCARIHHDDIAATHIGNRGCPAVVDDIGRDPGGEVINRLRPVPIVGVAANHGVVTATTYQRIGFVGVISGDERIASAPTRQRDRDRIADITRVIQRPCAGASRIADIKIIPIGKNCKIAVIGDGSIMPTFPQIRVNTRPTTNRQSIGAMAEIIDPNTLNVGANRENVIARIAGVVTRLRDGECIVFGRANNVSTGNVAAERPA